MFVLMALKNFMWKNFVKVTIVLFLVSGIVLYLNNEMSGYRGIVLTSGWFGLWGLKPLSTLFQLYRGVVSFIGGGNRSTQRKQPFCRKSLTNYIT